MALKDWTNVRKQKEHFKWIRTGPKFIEVDKDKQSNYWIISTHESQRFLKTKSQALKFAKSYMRKH